MFSLTSRTTPTSHARARGLIRGVVALSAAGALCCVGACSSGKDNAAPEETLSSSSATAGDSQDHAQTAVTLDNGYIKEKPAKKDMTAIFGVLRNSSDKDVTITKFTVEGLEKSTVYEQHEVVNGVMQEKEGGQVVPAHGEHVLEPGGDHLMIMENHDDMAVGNTYTAVIEFDNGETLRTELPVRVQSAGEEDYAPSK